MQVGEKLPRHMSSRLEERIMDLCAKAIAAKEPFELEGTIKELNASLREHTRRLRQRVLSFPVPPSGDLLRSNPISTSTAKSLE
jgi:hypothetical protein